MAYSYKDLMCRFEDTLRACAKKQGEEDSFPATIGINAFRGFLDEFAKKKESRDLPEVKLRKEKKKKEKDKGFAFVSGQFHQKHWVCSGMICVVLCFQATSHLLCIGIISMEQNCQLRVIKCYAILIVCHSNHTFKISLLYR